MRQITFLISVLTSLLISCAQTDNSNQTSTEPEIKNRDTLQNTSSLSLFNDTSKFSILIMQSDINFAFRKQYKIYTLNSGDLKLIEKKLLHSIDSFNVEGRKRMDKRQRELGPSVKIDRNYFVIDTSRYKFQIVAAINDKAEKEAWINAFCKDNDRTWRTEIITTKDGGICYFNSTINLRTNQIMYFMVNDDV